MSIDLDAEGKVQLRVTLGRRLRAARKAASMTEMDACRAVGHREQTQVSLWENGERMPTIQTLIKLADAYAVPVDWLLGRTDDPIACPVEVNQGVIVNTISTSMRSSFETLCAAISQQAAVTLEGYNADRRELNEMCVMSVEALSALRRIIELNPEFEEDWRGSATLSNTLMKMAAKGDEFGRRIESERIKFDVIDRTIKYSEMHANVEQCSLAFAD